MEKALASLAEEKDRPFVPTRPALARPVEYIIIAVGLLLCVLLYLLYGQVNQLADGQRDIRQTQAAGKIRTLVNRAIQCDLIKSIGAIQPKECYSAEVMPYRDPAVVPGTTSSRRSEELTRVLCVMIKQDPTLVVSDQLCPR